MSGKPYTQVEKIRIGMLAKTYHSYEIAEELGRTEGAIRQYCKRRGIRLQAPRPVDSEQRSNLMNLLTAQPGLSQRQAAIMLGRTQGSIWAMVHQLVKEGLLEKIGEGTRGTRYRPSAKWTGGKCSG